jgi:hypothetical protein
MRYTVVRAVVIAAARTEQGGRSVTERQTPSPPAMTRHPVRRTLRRPGSGSGPLVGALRRTRVALRVVVAEVGEAVCEELTDSPCLAVLVPLTSRVVARLRSLRRRIAAKRRRPALQGSTGDGVKSPPRPPAVQDGIVLVALHIVGRTGEGANSSGEAG